MKFVKPESSIKNPHAYAARSIRVGRKFPQSKKTLNAYINDAIDFRMIPEVGLYYSENCYGIADAINFANNFLRIHALRTKHKPADMKQLLIYDALFCLKHGIKPCDIQIENRIYQNDDVLIANPTFEDIGSIIEKIKEFDRVVREVKLGETA
nr:MAG TPA: hypothetical protein [Caudoviricetes sp.]